MYTIEQRANSYKQPYGGFIGIRHFVQTQLENTEELSDVYLNTVPHNIIGSTVDYLTRFMLGEPKKKAFAIPIRGVQLASKQCKMEAMKDETQQKKKNLFQEFIDKLTSFVKKSREDDQAKIILKDGKAILNKINGLDDESIAAACQIASFDVFYRHPDYAELTYRRYKDIDDFAIHDIKVMVNRGLQFFEQYGPVTATDFSFKGGTTQTVTDGIGDYLTRDCLWVFTASQRKPTTKHLLQILMFWIMGKHSDQKIFNKITKIGIFNARLNMVYQLDMHTLSDDMIKTVERDVIGYEEGDHIRGFSFCE